MAMSDQRIIDAMRDGNIVIEPFDPKHLSTSSYDVCIGDSFYREQEPKFTANVFNIYNQEHVKRVWGSVCTAERADKVLAEIPDHGGFAPDDMIILLQPGETILAHTMEFIGGRGEITTMMKARSSIGRSFLEVCKCLHPDTPVRMADGTEKRIDEIKWGDRVVNVDRYGRSRAARVKAVRRSSEPKKLMELRTKGGRSVKLSDDHLCRVSRSHGPVILPVRELKPGDAMPVLRRAPPVLTSSMTPDEAALLGYFVAEGNWQKYRITIAKDKQKREQRAEILALFNRVFIHPPEPIKYDQSITYNSVEFCAEFLTRYPECCEPSQHKRLPPDLMNASDRVIAEFMRTYILCDGSIRRDRKTPSAGYKSRSEGLIRDVTYLAARLGAAPAYFKTRCGSTGNPCLGASFYGNDAHTLGHPNEVTVDRSWSVDVVGLLNLIKKDYGLTRAQMLGYTSSDHKQMSRHKLQKLHQTHGVHELMPYVNDVVWDPIEEIVRSRLLQTGLVDISLDVASEQDALFALGDGLMTLNCAGWGDVGYINRWTMEVTNNSKKWHIPLLVGERVAQIVFLHAGPIIDKDYGQTGSYQKSTNIDEIMRTWKPSDMLPKIKRKSRGVYQGATHYRESALHENSTIDCFGNTGQRDQHDG